MNGIYCGCSLPPSACKTCSSLHPELYESHKPLQESHESYEIYKPLQESHDPLYLLTSPELGWICPVCGCGIAPNISQCFCQLNKEN